MSLIFTVLFFYFGNTDDLLCGVERNGIYLFWADELVANDGYLQVRCSSVAGKKNPLESHIMVVGFPF